MIQIADITINVTALSLWIVTAILGTAGFLGALKVVHKAVFKPVAVHVRNINTLANIAPAMLTFLEKDAPKLKAAAAQVMPNGGSSLADKITRIEIVCKDLQDQTKFNGALALNSLEHSKTPAFICDSKGFNEFVNESYCLLLNADSKDLLEFGWKQYVFRDDHYMQLWHEAFAEGRSFQHNIRFISKTGNDIYCVIKCNCLVRDGGKKFIGMLKQVWPEKDQLLEESQILSSMAERITI